MDLPFSQLRWGQGVDVDAERAHEQLFGTSLSISGDLLVKPHGDAANPQDHWVLPHQAGIVPSGVLDRIAELSRQRPRALLIVGYSGSDETAVALRAQAERENRSMQEVAREAIRIYVSRRVQLREQALRHIVDEDRDLLDRLAQ